MCGRFMAVRLVVRFLQVQIDAMRNPEMSLDGVLSSKRAVAFKKGCARLPVTANDVVDGDDVFDLQSVSKSGRADVLLCCLVQRGAVLRVSVSQSA